MKEKYSCITLQINGRRHIVFLVWIQAFSVFAQQELASILAGLGSNYQTEALFLKT